MKKFHTKDFLGKFSITFYSVIALAMLGLLSSCQSEDDLESSKARSTFLEFNITMPLASVTAGTGYENGTIEENSISNYRIYIYDTDNQYIMSLDDASISIEDTDLNTIYTITAEITDNYGVNQLENYSDFKIVMLANWETYTEPKEGSTIDDLCNSEYAQYSAFTNSSDFDLASSGKHIPFYGVHQYTGITFPKDGTVNLSGNLTLLRAMAKVEIIIDCEEDVDDNIALASATLHNYNSKGYCAPASVYSQDDYGQAKDWANDYTGENMHLVDGQNDSGQKNLNLYKVQDKMRDALGNVIQKETWIAYIPEYDNQEDDFSYIDIVLTNQAVTRDTQYRIYFALYDEDGTTKAYDSDADSDEIAKRRDIHRNNLYRFNVNFDLYYNLRVNVQDWENVFENEWSFGDMSRLLEVGDTIQTEEGNVAYIVTSNDETQGLTVSIIHVTNLSSYEIPEEVAYLGYTYTVACIESDCFKGDTETLFVSVPKTVTEIKDGAFSGDTGLIAISLHSETPPSCTINAFTDDDITKISIYVPEAYITNYEDDAFWSQFTIYKIEDM